MRRISVLVLMTLIAAGCGSSRTTTAWDDVEPLAVDDGFDVAPVDDEAGAPDSGDAADDMPTDDGVDPVVVDDEADDVPVGDVVEPAAQRILERAARNEPTSFRMALVAEFGGLEELGGETVSFAVRAAFSDDGRSGFMIFEFGDIMAAAGANGEEIPPELLDLFSDPIEMRFIGSNVYLSSVFFSWLVPIDTRWVAFEDDGSGSVDVGLDPDTFSAEEFLELLEVVDGPLEIVGSENIEGVDTVHVRGRISAAALAAIDPAFIEGLDPAETGVLEVDGFDLDVWIDDTDTVRRLRLGVDDLSALDPSAPPDSFISFTLDLTEVGGPVEVAPPPAEEVTWMDDIFAELGIDSPS